MSTIVTRAGKGSPLTHVEVDANFTNLNTDKVEKTAAAITGGTIDNTTIGATTASTGAFTTATASTSFASPVFKATSSAGGALQNSGGTNQLQWGGGGGNNVSVDVAININPANAQVDISPTGTGTVRINPATAGTINNTSIGATTPAAGTFTTLTGNSTSQFGRSSANYAQITGAASGSDPTFSALGSDTNINFTYLAKGSLGEHRFSTNTGGNTQFRITHTGSAANYLTVTGAATGAAPVLSAQGSDTNINLTLTPKGTGTVKFGTYTAGILAQTGYITITDSGGTSRRLLIG